MKTEMLKQKKRDLMRKLNDRRRNREIIDMPDGYISLKEWSIENGKHEKAGQKIMWRTPNYVHGAKKVRNPHGGVDIWAIPKGTPWPH